MSKVPIAFVGGSSFLESGLLKSFKPITINTTYGPAIIYSNQSLNQQIYFVQRHAADPNHEYNPPHLINKRSIIQALVQLGVKKIIAFGSVGSLKPVELPVGTIVVPDDLYDAEPISMYEYEKRGHIAPSFNEELRQELIQVLSPFNPKSKGTYTQTRGPRFESPAEVRMLALAGDLVGMTCAHEATMAKESGIDYAVVCMIDNIGNGLLDYTITYDEFRAGVAKNLVVMEKVLQVVWDHFLPQAAPTNQSNDQTKKSAASIVSAKYIVPMDDAETVLVDHAIVLNEAGVIIDLLPIAEAQSTYQSINQEHFADSVLMPGLINGHTHSGMSLMRGYADDFCLHDWLTEHIWPAEAKFVSEEFVKVSSELALAELIGGGCTTMNDMYWFPNVTSELVKRTGYRAVIGLPVLDFPCAWASDIDSYFNKGSAVREQFASCDRLYFTVAPHAPYTVCDAHMERVRETSAKAATGGRRVHTHLHETAAEVEHSVAGEGPSKHRSDERSRPLHNLDRLGLVNESLIAVHMTQLNKDDISLLAKRKANVVHCPSSNMKLASGFCPIEQLRQAGVNVGLGTDSTASNNSLDLWHELRFAALLAKGASNDPQAVPAYSALRMATIDGARVLGIDQDVGSLQKGKQGDFIVVNMQSLNSMPMYDVVSHLVYATGREQVTDVWCQGRRLLQNKRLVTIDAEALKREIGSWQTRLVEFKRAQLAMKAKPAAANVVPVIEAPATVIVDVNMHMDNGHEHHDTHSHIVHPPTGGKN